VNAEERAEARSPRSQRPSQDREQSYSEPRTASDIWIPNHRLYPTEADLRLVVNTLLRERLHWWLYTPEGRRQREFLERLGWWAA
jgi:hypothetical protein